MSGWWPVLLASLQVMPPIISHSQPLSGRVTLTLTADREQYSRGEAAHLILSARNVSDAPVVGTFMLDPAAGKMRISYRSGAGAFRSLTRLDERRDGVESAIKLDRDATVTHRVRIALDADGQSPLLDFPGDYEFRAEYSDTGDPNGIVQSNPLRLRVIDVPANAREALTYYVQEGLAFLAEFRSTRDDATPQQITAAGVFLDRFRGSLYWRDVRDGLWAALGERVSAKVAGESEKQLLERLTTEWAADDTTPPQMALNPTPSVLWPPNHVLVPVVVSVTVTDDSDPAPQVKLVSITCDDGCVPPESMAGADVGSDDREFELRAERAGGGTGRTYTITYEAVDGAGNKATVATSVSVPHDQRKK